MSCGGNRGHTWPAAGTSAEVLFFAGQGLWERSRPGKTPIGPPRIVFWQWVLRPLRVSAVGLKLTEPTRLRCHRLQDLVRAAVSQHEVAGGGELGGLEAGVEALGCGP